MFSTKIYLFLACCLAIAAATLADNEGKTGEVVQLTSIQTEDVRRELESSLNRLAAGDGPHYEISKVFSASAQVVSGNVVKRMNVDLVDSEGVVRNCKISILSRPMLVRSVPYSTETTIDCAGQKTLVENHSMF